MDLVHRILAYPMNRAGHTLMLLFAAPCIAHPGLPPFPFLEPLNMAMVSMETTGTLINFWGHPVTPDLYSYLVGSLDFIFLGEAARIFRVGPTSKNTCRRIVAATKLWLFFPCEPRKLGYPSNRAGKKHHSDSCSAFLSSIQNGTHAVD